MEEEFCGIFDCQLFRCERILLCFEWKFRLNPSGMSGEKVTLIGLGLLGGSVGLALRNRRLAKSVVGYARRKATIAEAKACGAVDDATSDLREAVAQADLILLCTPVGAMPNLAEALLPHCRKGVLLTDVGSVKNAVARHLFPLARRHSAVFVGSHPMAGSEKTGITHASASLFEGAVCVVTPLPETPQASTQRIAEFWTSLGGRMAEMSPARHDKIVSRTSHLPHVIASILAHDVLDAGADAMQRRLCASGFRDTTRVAAGNAAIWKDILAQNSDNVVDALDHCIEGLSQFRCMLREGNSERLADFLEEARSRRQAWKQAG